MRKRHIVLFVVSMEVPALPARLWPEGSEIMRASLKERDEFWSVSCWFSLSACCADTHVELRIQHVNVIFAFRQYLHGYVCLSLRLLGRKLAESQQQTQTGRSESLHISIKGHSSSSWTHVLAGTLDRNGLLMESLITCVLFFTRHSSFL